MSGRSPRWFTGIQYPWEDNFSDNTWAQIIEVCQKGIVPATWKVGNQKAMTIGGSTYMIDIIGILHDDYADGSGKAPLTFQLHDCYKYVYEINSSGGSVGGWKECKMRTTRLPTLLALMPSEVQAAIREVRKLSSAGNNSETIEATNDKLFLLSEVEIFGTTTYSAAGEGTRYEYYENGGSTLKPRVQVSGATYWWERSPRIDLVSRFCCVNDVGDAYNIPASDTRAVSFGFCY